MYAGEWSLGAGVPTPIGASHSSLPATPPPAGALYCRWTEVLQTLMTKPARHAEALSLSRDYAVSLGSLARRQRDKHGVAGDRARLQ